MRLTLIDNQIKFLFPKLQIQHIHFQPFHALPILVTMCHLLDDHFRVLPSAGSPRCLVSHERELTSMLTISCQPASYIYLELHSIRHIDRVDWPQLTTSLKPELPHPNISIRVSFPFVAVSSSKSGSRYAGERNQSKVVSGPSLYSWHE